MCLIPPTSDSHFALIFDDVEHCEGGCPPGGFPQETCSDLIGYIESRKDSLTLLFECTQLGVETGSVQCVSAWPATPQFVRLGICWLRRMPAVPTVSDVGFVLVYLYFAKLCRTSIFTMLIQFGTTVIGPASLRENCDGSRHSVWKQTSWPWSRAEQAIGLDM